MEGKHGSENEEDHDVYQCLVVDSGPIIRLTGASHHLWKQARHFYTVPAVLQEIRDAKARQHLEQLPFELKTREASREGIHAVSEFARLTGDYASLSAVDLQVLGLLYDLERESCRGDIRHIRTTPKRTLGLGKIALLGGKPPADVIEAEDCVIEHDDGDDTLVAETEQPKDGTLKYSETTASENKESFASDDANCAALQTKPKSWAALCNDNNNHSVAVVVVVVPVEPDDGPHEPIALPTKNTQVRFAHVTEGDDCAEGQFSDAESDENFDVQPTSDGNGSSSDPDEDCDAHVLDPDEVDERVFARQTIAAEKLLQQELQSEFPSLAASLTVPYDDSDDEAEETASSPVVVNDVASRMAAEEERKRRSLEPISKSGKLYNSFTKYGDLLKPKPKQKVMKQPSNDTGSVHTNASNKPNDIDALVDNNNQSRIIGGTSFAGQGDDVEDDGEGWITCTNDIRTIKAAGGLDPSRNPSKLHPNENTNTPRGPRNSERAACATTDFAMQNVILQMNLELLSVDGMKVRKLKNWVTRCGACFTVYTSSDNTGPLEKRLFCGRCGSDMMQRIAASVDGKTGRLRLHLSKKYKHNLRGTKFSLPKPGSGNRFQGDLLLREDQLLMGAWSQKVKMRSGGKAKSSAQSMFGRDIASNVGCHANAMTSDDIRVGFGRRNPNAAKGRERRGKKKKSTDKACGLRRY